MPSSALLRGAALAGELVCRCSKTRISPRAALTPSTFPRSASSKRRLFTDGGGGSERGEPAVRSTSSKDGAKRPATTQRRPVNVMDVMKLAREGKRKLTMVTAYDYPSALHVCRANIDILLVGDSVGMVELGYETTLPVTVDDMIHHCRAVTRGAKHPLIVGDMPFGSYEVNPEQALRTAFRFVKEGGVDAVKLEGGANRVEHVKKVVDGGVAVMGHVGLTPQAISVLGGFRAQGRTAVKARQLVDDALAIQDAGAFAVVIECVPQQVGAAITAALEIPTIGIGAGGGTDGQVLVYHDMLGMLQHPHHAQFVPKFCKKYANVGEEIQAGLEAFRTEVEGGKFPSEEHSPYSMSQQEERRFQALLCTDEEQRKEALRHTKKKIAEQDEYESIKLYGD